MIATQLNIARLPSTFRGRAFFASEQEDSPPHYSLRVRDSASSEGTPNAKATRFVVSLRLYSFTLRGLRLRRKRLRRRTLRLRVRVRRLSEGAPNAKATRFVVSLRLYSCTFRGLRLRRKRLRRRTLRLRVRDSASSEGAPKPKGTTCCRASRFFLSHPQRASPTAKAAYAAELYACA